MTENPYSVGVIWAPSRVRLSRAKRSASAGPPSARRISARTVADLLGPQRRLPEAAARCLLPLGSVLPLGDDGAGSTGRERGLEVECQLVTVVAAQEQALPHGVHDGRGIDWYWHGHARRLFDCLMPADEHVEDHAVDAVVCTVVGDGTDVRRGLAEPVDAALPLLVAGWVPR